MKNEVKQFIGDDGHSYVTLFKNGLGSDLKVCELMWENFKGKIPKGYEVGHIDGDKQNNKLDNLKLVKKYGQV